MMYWSSSAASVPLGRSFTCGSRTSRRGRGGSYDKLPKIILYYRLNQAIGPLRDNTEFLSLFVGSIPVNLLHNIMIEEEYTSKLTRRQVQST
jgi:hypothetical protein